MKVRPVKKHKNKRGHSRVKSGPKKGLYPRSTLTPEITKKFCELIRAGLTFDACCDYIGIAGTTFASWRQKGERWIIGNQEPAEYRVYGRFVMRLKRALAVYRLSVTKSLHNPKNNYWVRPLAILSRRDRLNWADREPQGGVSEEAVASEKFR